MAIKDVLKVNRKTFFDPLAWFGYESVKENTQFLASTTKEVFGAKPLQEMKKETFSEAMQRFNLSEADLAQTSATYFRYSLLYLAIAFGVLLLGGWFFLRAHFAGGCISLALIVFLLGQAFRYHFWHFQIKFKKLGCTFKEWRQGKPAVAVEESPK